MNALEFFTNVEIEKEFIDEADEMVILLPPVENELTYFHTVNEDGKCYYEYLTLTPKRKKYGCFYSSLKKELNDLPAEKQYELIQRMKAIELEYEPNIGYDELNDWYIYETAYDKYPLYSVRGTCNMEQECTCEPVFCKVHEEPCCFHKKVGCSDTSSIKYPEDSQFLIELILWMAVCPDIDVLYVLHDYPSVYWEEGELNFSYAFLLRDNKIKNFREEEEIKKLYEEYHKKYPCDTSETEDMINSWFNDVPDFHF